MRTKFITFFVTFFVMILLTPLIFGKLMNYKFDEMLNNLRKEGIVIKQIENKSSYIQTDRVFEVKVPGVVLKTPEIKYFFLRVEAKFKNLPVTNVEFLGKLEKIEGLNFDSEDVNKGIEDKIKFVVVTPNFRVYRYKIFNTSFNVNGVDFTFKNIGGVFVYPKRNDLKIGLAEFDSSNIFDLKITDYVSTIQSDKNRVFTDTAFNLSGKFGKLKFNLSNLKAKNFVEYLVKKVNVINDLEFKNLNILNVLDISNAKLKMKINNLDKKMIQALKNVTDKTQKEILLKKLCQKGFDVSADMNVSKISYLKENLGFLNVEANMSFKKSMECGIKNILLNAKIETSTKLANVLSMFPQSALFFKNAAIKNDKVVITIKTKEGKFLINGETIDY